MNSQHTTENLTIHHRVTDYTAWRKGYDAHEQNRRSAGITNGRVFRSAEDPNDVVVLQDVTDLAKARTFCGLGGCEGGDAKERRHRLAQRPLRDLSSEDHCSRDGSRHELLHYPCCETGTPPPAITAGGGVFRASRVATMWSHSYGPRWPDRPKRQPRISPSRSGGIKNMEKICPIESLMTMDWRFR